MKVFRLASVNDLESMNSVEPERLISACIAGDEHAIETLVHRYELDVFRLALSIINDEGEANEVTQETFITALKSLRNYQERTSFKAWLFTIAVNLSRSHLRKRKVLQRLKTTLTSIFQLETQKQPLPEDFVIQTEKIGDIWKSLNQLDEKHRTVVVLRYFHELSVSEIAQILSINEGTVHSRLHNARERLRDSLASLRGE